MYHAETLNAETKLREAERQEGRVKTGSSGGVEPVFGLRIEERHQRRNAARKMEKMREKVWIPQRDMSQKRSAFRTYSSPDPATHSPFSSSLYLSIFLSPEEGKVLREQAEDTESEE